MKDKLNNLLKFEEELLNVWMASAKRHYDKNVKINSDDFQSRYVRDEFNKWYYRHIEKKVI